MASASPSTSSARTANGFPDCMTLSRIGNRSFRFEILFSTTRRYGSSRTASIRSVSVTKYGEM
jgi:hypothetical protein